MMHARSKWNVHSHPIAITECRSCAARAGVFVADLTLAEVKQLRARQRLYFRDPHYNDLFQVRIYLVLIRTFQVYDFWAPQCNALFIVYDFCNALFIVYDFWAPQCNIVAGFHTAVNQLSLDCGLSDMALYMLHFVDVHGLHVHCAVWY